MFPTLRPSSSPSTSAPTGSPSGNPSRAPVVGPTTTDPTNAPSSIPSLGPTASPTPAPTPNPTFAPFPGATPSSTPDPTPEPTPPPTLEPTTPSPTFAPFPGPSPEPMPPPTSSPTSSPTTGPTMGPTSGPTVNPSTQPTFARQPPGATCVLAVQCASSLCDSDICKSILGGECSNGDHCIEGTCYLNEICADPVDVGLECSSDTDCSSDLLCSGSICMASLGGDCEESDHCLQGICYLGETCANAVGVDVGLECSSDTDCSSGLLCSGSIYMASLGGDCEENEHCLDGTCYIGDTFADPVDVGFQCSSETDCTTGHTCALDDSVCKANLGEACSVDYLCNPPLSCIPGGFCDSEVDIGSPCDSDNDCISEICASNVCKAAYGGFCYGENDLCSQGTCYLGQICNEPETFGGLCLSESNCEGGITCETTLLGGQCYHGEGVPCESASQCVPGDFTCFSNTSTCGRRLSSGGACNTNSDCMSDVCLPPFFLQSPQCL